MQHALLACILASVGCGVIGTYVVVKRIGFLAGGIAHSVLAGMGIAYFMGSSPLLGATLAAGRGYPDRRILVCWNGDRHNLYFPDRGLQY